NTNNTITFTEASKPTTGTPNTIFSSNDSNEFLTFEITDSIGNFSDKLDFILGDMYTSKYDNKWDALKMINPDVNFYSICNDTIFLAIDRRPNLFTSIPLGFTGPIGNYNFLVKNLPTTTGKKYYLKDNYLHTTTLLTNSTELKINITNETASTGNNRFELTTNSSTILPVNFISFTGTKQLDGVHLVWKVADEINLNQYEIEKSENGNSYTTIKIIKAASKELYDWIDNSNFSNKCYFRINAKSNDGSFQYSKAIHVDDNLITDFSINISPNPIRDILKLNYSGLNEKDYTAIIISDNNGKQLTNINIGKVKTGQYNLNIKNYLKGHYIVQLHNGTKILTRKIIKE
ncbi:MAG: T9SS type A sorting domain-containing protein, partial [Chitinophagaceae bacterium]